MDDIVWELAAPQIPREVVLAAGTWLGANFQDNGFEWLPSRLTLQRSVGTLRHQIHFQASKDNRQGGSITVQTMLNVRDTGLRRWRKDNPDRVTGQDDYVCGHFLGYGSGRADGHLYGEYRDGEIDLSDPPDRERHLRAWAATVREAVLPWFTEASDPDLIIKSRAAEMTSSPGSIIEWLASKERTDLVPAFLDWYLQRHPAWREGVTRRAAFAAAGQRPAPFLDRPVALGWTAARVSAS